MLADLPAGHGLFAEDGLIARLRDLTRTDWEAYIGHDFVRGLGRGDLPRPAFRHYLIQDYLFLIQFARAYALAAFKAETLDDMRAAAETLRGLTDTEMKLHVRTCAGWGLTEAQMAATPEDLPTIAYTRFVIDAGLKGDLLDLLVALSPCVVGYGEIGLRLKAAAAALPEGDAYRDWIEAYSGEEYLAIARAAADQIDRVWRERGAEARLPALTGLFAAASRLEAAFWQMGLDAAARATDI